MERRADEPKLRLRNTFLFPLAYVALFFLGIPEPIGGESCIWYLSFPLGLLALVVAGGSTGEGSMIVGAFAILFLGATQYVGIGLYVDHWLLKRRLRYLREAAICPYCGYSLVGNVSGRCPECGEPMGDGVDKNGEIPADNRRSSALLEEPTPDRAESGTPREQSNGTGAT